MTAADAAAYRADLSRLAGLSLADLQAVWASWDWSDPRAATAAALAVVPDVVWAGQDTTGGFAADAYDGWREQAGVGGRFRASPAVLAAEDQILAGVRNAVGPLWQEAPDVAAARQLLSGSVGRLVMHGANDTVVGAARADPQAVGWARVARPGACRFCRMLAGRGGVYRSAKSARFAAHDNCIPADVLVQSPAVERGYRRRYDGELVVIRTSGMQQLPITPNHPVLTHRGWVPAGLLRVGDQVVVGSAAQREPSLIPYEQNVPTLAEEVWGADRMYRLRRVPVAAENFHGDVGSGYNHVDVVTSDRPLPFVFDALLREPLAEGGFAGAWCATVLHSFFGEGDPLTGRIGPGASAYCGMGGFSQGGPLGRGQFRHAYLHGFGGCPHGEPHVVQPSCDDVAGYSIPAGHREDALASGVPLGEVTRGGLLVGRRVGVVGRRFDPAEFEGLADDPTVASAELARDLRERLAGAAQFESVVDLGRREFSGHVYNFQTSEGWYAANGVVVSNCRCAGVPSWDSNADEVPVIAYVASRRVQSAADRARVRRFLDENFPGEK